MTSLRRYSLVALAVACTHLVFGAIVRISGSGMGCGDHWPKCYGRWFPPMERMDLVIEVMHRYLAAVLGLVLLGLFIAAFMRRREPRVGGPGGVVRSAGLALALVIAAGALGAITVKLGNAPFATLAHWTVAMSLVAAVAATVMRAGGLGGDAARLGGSSPKTARTAAGGAALALLAVVLGGLTAKYPGAAVACPSFPLCGTNPDVLPAAVHVQLTHRVLAFLVLGHLFGLVMALRKREDAPVVRRAAAIALGLAVTQWLVAGAMIGMRLPPVLRSLHEATGVAVWIATFVVAYLARIASGGSALGRPAPRSPTPAPPVQDDELAVAGAVRAPVVPRQAFSSAVVAPDAASDAASEAASEAALEAAAEPEPWRAVVVPLEATAVVEPLVVVEPPRRAADPSQPADTETARALGRDIGAAAALGFVALTASVTLESARAVMEEAAASAPRPLVARPTMSHSVAVIVARGADL